MNKQEFAAWFLGEYRVRFGDLQIKDGLKQLTDWAWDVGEVKIKEALDQLSGDYARGKLHHKPRLGEFRQSLYSERGERREVRQSRKWGPLPCRICDNNTGYLYFRNSENGNQVESVPCICGHGFQKLSERYPKAATTEVPAEDDDFFDAVGDRTGQGDMAEREMKRHDTSKAAGVDGLFSKHDRQVADWMKWVWHHSILYKSAEDASEGDYAKRVDLRYVLRKYRRETA